MRFTDVEGRTPTRCEVCNAVYDVETGRGIRHRIIDFFVGLVDRYIAFMDNIVHRKKRGIKNASG